jgi:putative sporulation protein YyaC
MYLTEENFLKQIKKEIKDTNKRIILFNIGTEKRLGDSFGPLLGTLLSEIDLKNIVSIGSLNDTITALNVKEKWEAVKSLFPNDIIVSTDAIFYDERIETFDELMIKDEGISPAKGMGKDLNTGEIGDYCICFPIPEYSELYPPEEAIKKVNIKQVYTSAKKAVKLIANLDKSI